MTEIFADTSGLASLLTTNDGFQAQASRIFRDARAKGNVVTTNYVLSELVALLDNRFRIPRPILISNMSVLMNTKNLIIVHVDQEFDQKAWALLRSRPDKNWSLVDCASFILMKERGISEALTTDHHFEQAGFTVLLK